MKDDLGDRMKEFYEKRTRIYLPRRTYTVMRLDMKCGHTYTRGLNKPFDEGLIEDMQETMRYLCANIQGCKIGYCQSDEISLVLTDFDTLQTDAWFDGQVQKICSIAASMATAKFNQLRLYRKAESMYGSSLWHSTINENVLAFFDCRVFTIPEKDEVCNYLRWRQQDAVKNSISMVAQSLYSPKELHGKNGSDKQEMIFQKGQNWNDYPAEQKRGATCLKVKKDLTTDDGDVVVRSVWEIQTPDYTGEAGWEFLNSVIL